MIELPKGQLNFACLNMFMASCDQMCDRVNFESHGCRHNILETVTFCKEKSLGWDCPKCVFIKSKTATIPYDIHQPTLHQNVGDYKNTSNPTDLELFEYVAQCNKLKVKGRSTTHPEEMSLGQP